MVFDEALLIPPLGGPSGPLNGSIPGTRSCGLATLDLDSSALKTLGSPHKRCCVLRRKPGPALLRHAHTLKRHVRSYSTTHTSKAEPRRGSESLVIFRTDIRQSTLLHCGTCRSMMRMEDAVGSSHRPGPCSMACAGREAFLSNRSTGTTRIMISGSPCVLAVLYTDTLECTWTRRLSFRPIRTPEN